MKNSYFKGATDPGLLDETIGQCFRPNRAAVSQIGKHWSSGTRMFAGPGLEFQREVDKLATGLLALGIGAGDRVGIWAPNCYEWCLTQFATRQDRRDHGLHQPGLPRV